MEYAHYFPTDLIFNNITGANPALTGFTVQRGLVPANRHLKIRPEGNATVAYLTFGVLVLSELEPAALLAAYKAHQDYSNPDVTKLLSKNPADRLSTQVQAYYASLSPLLVLGFHSMAAAASAHPFKDTFVGTGFGSGATTTVQTAARMGGAHGANVEGGIAADISVLTLPVTMDARCHKSGKAKSFLVTGHAVSANGSKMMDAECEASNMSVFAIDIAGTVSDMNGNGDMRIESPDMVAGKIYSFQDLAIAPNFVLSPVA